MIQCHKNNNIESINNSKRRAKAWLTCLLAGAVMASTALFADNALQELEKSNDNIIKDIVDLDSKKNLKQVAENNRLLAKGREEWVDGKLTKAISTIQEKKKQNPESEIIAKTLKSMLLQKKMIDDALLEVENFLAQGKLKEARHSLTKAELINKKYPPYVEMLNRIAKTGHAETLTSANLAEIKQGSVTTPELQPEKLLFDGSLGKQWKELAAYGGDFKKFAKIEDEVLLVDVPEGNSWGKTGIRSAEALFKIPEKEDKLSEKLTFTIDPSRSSDYILAIIPSNWDGNLEWRSHYIRVSVQKDEEKKNSILTLWIRASEMMKVNLESSSIKQLSIEMRPDRIVLVTDGSGSILLQGLIPENRPIYKDGYKVSVLTHAPKKDMSATLALKTISLERAPYEKIVDLSVVQDKPQKYALFDGKILGQRWKPYVDAKVTFDDTARISNGALDVDVPEKSGYANVGIESNEPVIWLDQFGKDSKRQVLFRFIPEQTTGFAIALSNKGNHFIVKWFKDSEKGKAFIQIYQSNNLGLISNWNSTYKPVWEKEVDTNAPSEVKLTLTPEGIKLSGDQLPEHLQTWPQLQANSGYFIYAYSFPAIPDKAVKMALKEISLDNEVFSPDMPTKPALGVDPLPVIELFSGNKREGWELTPWQIYKKPVDACHLNEKGFSVSSVPEDTPLAGCDIHPDKQIVNIDKRIDSANYQISAYFDPQKTKNFRIAVTPHKRHNWKKYYEACYLNLLQSETKQNIFSFNCGAKKLWQRTVTTEWLKQKWSGRVNILIGKSGMQAELENDVKISIPSTRSRELYVYFVAPDTYHQKNSAEFLLTKLTGQWIAPEGMTVLDRWNYIDEQDFNPEQYLKDLKDELRK